MEYYILIPKSHERGNESQVEKNELQENHMSLMVHANIRGGK
jgi:hypothetical protein